MTTANDEGGERPARQQGPTKCNLWDAQCMVTIKSGDREWSVHENVLTQESAFFRKVLDDSSLQGQQNILKLERKDPYYLGSFFSCMYASAMTPPMTTFIVHDYNLPSGNKLKLRVELWKLADYFQHDRIQKAAEKSFFELLEKFHQNTRITNFRNYSEESRNQIIQCYVEAWNACSLGGQQAAHFKLPIERNLANNMCEEAIKIMGDKAQMSMMEAIMLRMAMFRDETNDALRQLQLERSTPRIPPASQHSESP